MLSAAASTTASKFTEMPVTPNLFNPSRSVIKPTPFTFLFLKPFSATTSTTVASASGCRVSKNSTPDHPPKPHSSSWLNQWPSPPPPPPTHSGPSSLSRTPKAVDNYAAQTSKATTSAIDRIVLRLRNLGLGSDDEDEEEDDKDFRDNANMSVTGEEKLGDLLKREWVRPDTMLLEDDEEGEDAVLPWEREERGEVAVEETGVRKRSVKAPTLAELTIEDGELRRLRKQGMTLRERINVPKAGVTNAVLDKIHEKWRKNELVRLKFHEVLARDMKTAHEIVEVGMLQNYCFASYG